MSKNYAIAIDLGTSNSCIAVFNNDTVEIIPNEFGNKVTPSVIAFDKETGQRYIGDEAKGKLDSIYEIKRLMGRFFTDPTLKSDMKILNYKIHQKDNRPVIEVTYMMSGKINQRNFAPEEISAMILDKMKTIAETYLGEPIRDCVITVPAYFSDFQRQSTKDAATIAGLNVKRLINEPTAAALAYGFQANAHGQILVFDFGGGTFDVSLLSVTNGFFEVLAVAGDTHLGGADIDDLLVKWALSEFKKKTKKMPTKDPRAMRRLHSACETLKRTLSSSIEGNINLENFYAGLNLDLNLTRDQFDLICENLFKQTLIPIEKVLEDSGIEKEKVDEIILVGGSTRIPKIQKIVSDFFNGKILNKRINVDEAVAYGAAIQASILTGIKSEKTEGFLLMDICPLSLGIEVAGGQMSVIMKRGTTVPSVRKETFSTSADNQNSVKIKIYEGERTRTDDNNYLGTFNLTGIPNKQRGEPRIDITFDLDADGILKVSAKLRGGQPPYPYPSRTDPISSQRTGGQRTGSSGTMSEIFGGEGVLPQAELVIDKNQGHLTKKQIEKMIKEAEEYREEDLKFLENIKAKSRLEECLYKMKRDILNMGSSPLLHEINETFNWMETPNLSASHFDAKRETILKKV